jgi:hypothetical protein
MPITGGDPYEGVEKIKNKFYKFGKNKGKLKSTKVTYSPYTVAEATSDNKDLVEDPTRIGKRKITKRKVKRDGSDGKVTVKYRK